MAYYRPVPYTTPRFAHPLPVPPSFNIDTATFPAEYTLCHLALTLAKRASFEASTHRTLEQFWLRKWRVLDEGRKKKRSKQRVKGPKEKGKEEDGDGDWKDKSDEMMRYFTLRHAMEQREKARRMERERVVWCGHALWEELRYREEERLARGGGVTVMDEEDGDEGEEEEQVYEDDGSCCEGYEEECLVDEEREGKVEVDVE